MFYIKMKKARNIKVIKFGSTERNDEVALAQEISKAVAKKCHPDKIVNDWVREHQEQKELAHQIALNLLYSSERVDQIEFKNSNR